MGNFKPLGVGRQILEIGNITRTTYLIIREIFVFIIIIIYLFFDPGPPP